MGRGAQQRGSHAEVLLERRQRDDDVGEARGVGVEDGRVRLLVGSGGIE